MGCSGIRRSAGHSPAALVVCALVLGGCGGNGGSQPAGQGSPASDGLASRATDAAADTRVLSEAQDAANTVVRATGDCDAVKAAMPEALRALDVAAGKLRTATARDSLARLREQLRKVADACP